MMTLRKIAFILEDFVLGAPGQHLLDRFLIGYLRDGEFRRVPALNIAVWLTPARGDSTSNGAKNLALRQRDFQLVQSPDLAAALRDADAVVVAPALNRVAVSKDLLGHVLEQAPVGARCFIHGCLATNVGDSRLLLEIAASRKLVIATGTPMTTAIRLPDVEVNEGTPLREGLIVVQGAPPAAELAGIEGLLPVISRRVGGEAGLQGVRRVEGGSLWRAAEKGEWSWPLLAAAISRSSTTQGDPVRDGRTQDLVGRGLVRKLARHPRGWLLEHRDGFRSAVMVLDGVVADCNFAVRSRDNTILSAQLYQPAGPNRCGFDRLAAALENFFTTGKAWPAERSLVVSRFMESVIGKG